MSDSAANTLDDFERFCREIHRSLDLVEAGTLIANETRLLAGVDRVTVAVRRGRNARLIAASGVETIVQRSEQCRLLTALCSVVLQTEQEAEWSAARPDAGDAIADPLTRYVQATHLRAVTLIPLFAEPPILRDDDPKHLPHPAKSTAAHGVLTFEQYTSAEVPEPDRELRRRLSRQAAVALHNALLHSSIFLRGPLLAVGRSLAWFRGRRRAGAAVAAAFFVLVILAGCFLQCEYKVTCDGVLITKTRTDVFAAEDGVVDDVHVVHNAAVSAGDRLLQLRNDELEARHAVAAARVNELEKLIRSYQTRIHLAEQQGLAAESAQLQADQKRTEIELHGARDHLRLLNQQLASLAVRAPASGRVATFQLREELINRPVSRGDRLVQVYPPNGPWILELRVPEYRSGYVLNAMRQGPPTVEFILATHVELTRYAVLTDAATIVETSEDDGTAVLVRASLREPDTLPQLNYGAECHARIHCGRYSVGWWLLGDVIEFLQRHFWI